MTLTCMTCAHQHHVPHTTVGFHKRPRLPEIIPNRDHHCPRCNKVTRHLASLQDLPTANLDQLRVP